MKENSNIDKLEIFDISGRQVYNSQFSILNHSLKIDVSLLQSGIYILQITTDKGIATHKFIKE
jgi:hypothetical protein